MNGAFVGRERELSIGLRAIDDALGGDGRLLLVAGEAGIGKSRLADQLADAARARSMEVLWGRCWEAGGAPAYWPWVQSLRAHAALPARAGVGPELDELLGGVSGPPAADPESARFRLFDATARFLRAAAEQRPLMIVLDDLHAADESSLLLLRFVAGELAGTRLLIVGCYRDATVEPGDALSATLAELSRERAARYVTLGGVAREDVGRYIELTAGIEPSHTLVGAIHAETEGNPLFFGGVVELLLSEQRLQDAGLQRRLTIPRSLREVIDRRLRQLSEPCVAVLRLAAVLGREFAIEALSEVAREGDHDVTAALREGQARRVLIDAPDSLGRLRFAHALVRDALYEQLPVAARPAVHRSSAEALERLYGAASSGAHLAELAHHWCAAAPAGDALRAVDYARRAGDRASELLAFEEAARLYETALQALALADRPQDVARCDLLLALGDAYARAGDVPTAQRAFLDAARQARALGSPEALARAALGYGGRFVWEAMRGDRLLVGLLEEALTALGEQQGPLRVRLLARLAGGPLRDEPDRERRAALSAEAVALARRLEDPATLVYALDGRYAAIWWPDNLDERLAVATELVEAAADLGDEERELQGRHYRCLARLELGDVAGVYDDLEAKGRLARALRQPAHDWYVASVQATLATFEGRLAEAERLVPRAFGIGRRAQGSMVPVYYTIQRYLLLRERGRLEELQDELAQTAATFPTYPVLRCLLAHLHAELGRVAPARRELERLVLPFDDEWLFGMSVLADVIAFLGDRERAAAAHAALLPYADRFAVSNPDGCVGSIARPLGVLAATVGDHDAAGHWFATALEHNARAGARLWAAQTRVDWARMLVARDAPGDRDEAQLLLRAALVTAREVGAGTLEAKASSALAAIGTLAVDGGGTDALLRREGDYWTVRYGAGAFRMRDGKGLRYLAELLGHPGREIAALALAAGPGGDPAAARAGAGEGLGTSAGGDAGELLDSQARRAYGERLAELDEQVDEAERFNDPERAEQARAEIEALTGELSAALGLGGRARRAPGHAERARQSVTKAIRTTIARLAEHDPALGEHLRRTVHTGVLCRYDPDARGRPQWTL